MKALSLYPYYQKRGQCEFTLTSLRLWQQHCSLLREKKEATYGEREQEEERNHSCFVSIDAACLPPHVVVIVSWRSQSASWVLSVFACHLVSCGGVKENQRSTMHITGGSWGPSVSMSRKNPTQTLQKINKIKNGSWEQRMKSLPYACIENYTIWCYPNMRELWFSRNWTWGAIFFHLPFQVFVWRAGIEILPLLHYFQHTWRASSSTAEHM